MKRAILVFGILIVAALAPAKAFAGVNDFTIDNFQADYYLSKTADGRSSLRTIEHITAQFPDFDQNHGIERAIPHAYDGHPVHLDIQSVKKQDGSEWNYTTYSQGDATVIRIGDGDKYVHGQQEYDITYTQKDVTKFFTDTNDDELYWDTNGTGWSQPFTVLAANVYIDKSLATKLNGKVSCYQGLQGSSQQCTIVAAPDAGDKKVFNVNATRLLGPGENVTFAIGFKPHTFTVYKATTSEKMWALFAAVFAISFVLGGVIGALLITWLVVHYYRNKYRKGDMGPIAPEYTPPKNTSVLTAAKVFSEVKGNPQSAQIIDLAVRHYIKIYQTEEKGLFRGAEYDIELVKPLDDLLPEEKTFVATLFGGQTRLPLKTLKNNTRLYNAFRSNDATLTKALIAEPYAIYERDTQEKHWFRRFALICTMIGVFTLSPFILLAAAVAFAFSFTTVQVSEKGLALERYLYGLRDYIKLAETDRLRTLQSPVGAEKVGEAVDGTNTAQLIKLYEKALPYAVLFGEEKQWNEQLAKYYQTTQTNPVWYTSPTAFNAAAFSSAMSSFSASAAASSSSGGSGGGGSSGGGGGGGCGGGW